MKIYARQISPENQISNLDAFDIDEGIIADGNKNLRSYTIPAYDDLLHYFGEMAETWMYECGAEWYYGLGSWVFPDGRKKPHISIARLLQDYGFQRADGKAWSNSQKHQWRELMESDGGMDDESARTAALSLLTGHEWDWAQISGCCQGDWQTVYYQCDMWSREALDHFEIDYFNLGSEWEIHEDDDIEPTCADDVSGVCMYCYSWNKDGIKEEIAEYACCDPDDVHLFGYFSEYDDGDMEPEDEDIA